MNEVTREQACSHKKQASCGMRRPMFVGLAQKYNIMLHFKFVQILCPNFSMHREEKA